MYINGKAIRDRIQHELSEVIKKGRQDIAIAIIIVGENPVIEGFVALKKRFAQIIGVRVVEERFPQDVSNKTLLETLERLAEDSSISGIVVQLPLPSHIETQEILNHIPLKKDVDVLSQNAIDAFTHGTLNVLPPVVGAVAEVVHEINIPLSGKKVLVVGQGRLVGAPVATWFMKQGAHVTIVDRASDNLPHLARASEIIVAGAGVPGLITADMITPESILIDAGTSESAGRIVGDIDARAGEKARYATPVPGGVGPVTVSILFRNLVLLHEKGALK